MVAWLAGRLAMWWYGPLWAWVDLLFLPLVAGALWRVLVKSGNQRNYFLLVLLVVLMACNALFHASVNNWLGWAGYSAIRAVHVALFLMVVLITVIGGRVMPMFSTGPEECWPFSDLETSQRFFSGEGALLKIS